MASCEISPEALNDLQSIYDFIAEDSPTAADSLLEELFELFDRLLDMPRTGHSRPDLTNRDVLFWPVKPYLVVYRGKMEGIQIVAVLHGARDIPSILQGR